MKPISTLKRTSRATVPRRIAIDGNSLTIEKIMAVVDSQEVMVTLSSDVLRNMAKHREVLMNSAKSRAIYGVNTGFGPMVTHIIGADETTELQYNLLRGHAMGAGEPIDSRFVLASMLVRLNTLAKGNSAASPELAQTLAACINARIIPIVPEHGAVGTSGDLVQLAHIALLLIGEGQVTYMGVRQDAQRALARAGIAAHKLGPKEGLSLINGTSVMTGIGAVLAFESKRALSLAVRAGGLAFELVEGFTDVIDPALHETRPHPGQIKIAALLRDLTRDSKMLSNRETLSSTVEIKKATHVTDILLQEVYSLRCIPQVLGPIFDTVERSYSTISTEINSVTDNPIVDLKTGRFLHGGNFHGDYVATAVDQLKAALIKMTLLSERRTNFFLNKNVNKTFSPFLNLKMPGLTMGLQGLQFVSTSTTAHSQSLGYPHSLHSISTNGDNQDIVSMGTDAALIASKVLQNAFIVIGIELIALSQASKLRDSDKKLSSAGGRLVEHVRGQIRLVTDDRSLSGELNAFCTVLRTNSVFDLK